MTNIHILTLFPKMFEGFIKESIINRAQKKKLLKINIYNLRDWAKDKHKTVDDKTYGGGPGMLLKPDVIDSAIASIKSKTDNRKLWIVLLTPKGKTFKQKMARAFTQNSDLLFICGHYEGFDERIRKLVDLELSIGDYVLTGGELPAMVIADAVIRLIPGVINQDSLKYESFNCKCGDFPQYTRPEKFAAKSKLFKKSLSVPATLLSGNHKEIEIWRKSNL